MKHLIDIDTWERKDNYLFFRDFHNSWIAMTGEVDCTEAYAEAKAQGRSFFLYYLYAILRAANEIKEFRYRWDKHGQVVCHDTVDITTPIALTVSHAFVDGAHISLFFEKVEKYLKER